MTKLILTVILAFSILTIFGQNKIRPGEKLINRSEPGWRLIQQWIDKAKNKVEVLPCDSAIAKDALSKTQVTARSPLGAIIYSTGGLLIEYGWMRILGSGSIKLNRTLPEWNNGKSLKEFGDKPSFLLIADDVIGGFFAVNGGQFGKDVNKIYYLSPDNLKWKALGLTYTEFLNFCFNGDLNKFYKGLRWTNWQEEVSKLDGNLVYTFYPFLWTKEGKNIDKVSRRPIPIEEQFKFNMSRIAND